MNDPTHKERRNTAMGTVLNTEYTDLHLVKRGKVRDMYDLGDSLLLVASDRISAFDVVMPEGIPDKGKILNQFSLFWFDIMQNLVPNHVISGDVRDYPDSCKPYTEELAGRSMLVKKTEPLPIECVVRGYISGSGWKSYQENQQVCGIQLQAGLKESDMLPEPIFTPSTKEEVGMHDINIDFDETVRRIGQELAEKVRDLSLAIYKQGADLALEKGIIIADTKFEFGLAGNELILIDEVLTPDSSRFWPQAHYEPGKSQKSFDKQYLRDYLLSINWNKQPPAPHLPEDVVANTREKYLEALRLITGQDDVA
jgi:phosphoribosylaminoimidazole-succinocarboxamide synthase